MTEQRKGGEGGEPSWMKKDGGWLERTDDGWETDWRDTRWMKAKLKKHLRRNAGWMECRMVRGNVEGRMSRGGRSGRSRMKKGKVGRAVARE